MGKKITNEEFLVMLYAIHGDNIIVLDEYNGMNCKINFQCRFGHIFPAEPHNVLRGSGCPYCSGHKALKGYNDLCTTRPDIASLLSNPEDGYKYTKSAHAKVDFICPLCGNKINKRINDVYNKGLVCTRCSDGISYPNKFARNFLDQLPIENHICEYHPMWAKPYFYDNYFEYNNEKYILEMDGGFHYKDVPSYSKTLKDAQEIDKLKTELAMQNGMNIIRIDCQQSDCDYIKNNILDSELSAIFDLSNIDWNLCNKMAHKSLLKQACDLFMSGITNLREIADMLDVDRTTILRYVKTGTKYGWCDYDPKKSIKEAAKYGSKSIPIIIVDDNFNIIHRFCSVRECESKIKEQYKIGIWDKKIIDACKTHEPYHGFNFRFASEFNNNN